MRCPAPDENNTRGHTMSKLTQKAMAQAISDLLQTRTLDKITIKDITDACDLTRNTFYYHFHDVYDLLRWLFEEKSREIMERYEDQDDWEGGLEETLNYIYDNKAMFLHIYESISYDLLFRFISKSGGGIGGCGLELYGVAVDKGDGGSGTRDKHGFAVEIDFFYVVGGRHAATGVKLCLDQCGVVRSFGGGQGRHGAQVACATLVNLVGGGLLAEGVGELLADHQAPLLEGGNFIYRNGLQLATELGGNDFVRGPGVLGSKFFNIVGAGKGGGHKKTYRR